MANLPSPVTNTDQFLSAVLDAIESQTAKLEEIRCCLIDVETELQKLNISATQKPSIHLDVGALSEKIVEKMAAKGTKSRVETKPSKSK